MNRCAFRSNIATIFILGTMSALASGCARTAPASIASSKSEVGFGKAGVYGRAVNLRASDVPKFVMARFPRSRTIEEGPFGAYVERCDGVMAGAHEVVGSRSGRFQHIEQAQGKGGNLIPRESVQSAVFVMRSSELAYREVVAAMSSHGLQCARRSFVGKNVNVKPEGIGPACHCSTKSIYPMCSCVSPGRRLWECVPPRVRR